MSVLCWYYVVFLKDISIPDNSYMDSHIKNIVPPAINFSSQTGRLGLWEINIDPLKNLMNMKKDFSISNKAKILLGMTDFYDLCLDMDNVTSVCVYSPNQFIQEENYKKKICVTL